MSHSTGIYALPEISDRFFFAGFLPIFKKLYFEAKIFVFVLFLFKFVWIVKKSRDFSLQLVKSIKIKEI